MATGNLVRYDDTWHIMDDASVAPANSEVSLCRIDARPSEYAPESQPCAGPKAWWSKSWIPFNYRVVEVPAGDLLNPECDALVFGHLEPGSPERAEAMASPQRRLVVIDEKVHELYGDRVRSYFTARGVAHELLVLNTVEENKSIELTLDICKKMKKFNLDRRREPVIGIGGGVCLDVVGLAASMFRRRTPYIRVPTTALAYVDASVGAKNGCNFCGSKNRLGTYVPPVAALLDSSFFRTQGARDISNSLGEMCKMGIMKSEELLGLLEKHASRLIADRFQPQSKDDTVPSRVLQIAIETMLEELTPNLWEDCLDRLVDFGHGVGQCLEMDSLGLNVELMHGEAVATDMSFMTVLSNVLGHLSDCDRDRILGILHTCGLPTWHPVLTRDFFKVAMEDRIKNSLGMRLPLPVGMGKARMFNDVTDEQFEATFVKWESLCKHSTVSVAKSKARMERVFLFSSESVNEGHPDKLCDQVSDAVLDACLAEDPKSKVACETAAKDNMVMVAGEITTQAKLDYEKVVRGVVAKIGFDSYVDDLSSVDSKGLCNKTCEVLVRINKQSPDIAGGVHVGKDDLEVGAGDQGIMFGYASDETEDCMPLTHSVATKLGKKLTDVRKNGNLWWLRPDGKTQVTIEYLQKADGSVEPKKLHTIVISTQHAEPSRATRCKEVAGYTGADETAPSMEEMNRLIVEEVIKATLSEIMLKNGQPALTLFGDFTHLHINPSGKFIIGGPQGDAGLTGRKIIIDTYGGWGAHGGGAFSGKDPTKVDRSAAYICRQMAKSVVKSGLCKRALVQLSYAIGVAKPLSIFVETYGTEQGDLTPDDVTNIVKIEFDCRPGAIAAALSLREPKYQETAAYCHFGREPVTKDGIHFFAWESSKDLTKYKPMNSAEVTAVLKDSNYLTKWVD